MAMLALACNKSKSANAAPTTEQAEQQPKVVEVKVDDKGYTPSSVDGEAGKALTLRFIRTTEKGCGDKLVVPSRQLKKDLPLNQPVDVKLIPKPGETIAFTCGMGMYKGSVVVASN